MKVLFTLLAAVCCLAFTGTADAAIDWKTNYKDAVAQANQSQKPMILFFTGSDWCGWCKKLHSEVFGTQEFSDKVGDKFIFVMIDFPQKTQLPKEIQEQNKQLMKQYQIEGYPTVVILDQNQKRIATAGYRAGGASQYANYLMQTTGKQ